LPTYLGQERICSNLPLSGSKPGARERERERISKADSSSLLARGRWSRFFLVESEEESALLILSRSGSTSLAKLVDPERGGLAKPFLLWRAIKPI
jgi:hypothetical protein